MVGIGKLLRILELRKKSEHTTYMTVNQLIRELQKLPKEMGNCQVIMSKDAEGNSYSPMAQINDDCYCKASKHYYIDSIYTDSFTYEENGFETQEEWDEFKLGMDRIVVVYPTN